MCICGAFEVTTAIAEVTSLQKLRDLGSDDNKPLMMSLILPGNVAIDYTSIGSAEEATGKMPPLLLSLKPRGFNENTIHVLYIP